MVFFLALCNIGKKNQKKKKLHIIYYNIAEVLETQDIVANKSKYPFSTISAMHQLEK